MYSLSSISMVMRPRYAMDDDKKQIDGFSTPDLWISGQLWEIKSPRIKTKSSQKEGNELKYIDNQLKAAVKNFSNPYDPTDAGRYDRFDGKRRVILNLKYRPSPVGENETIEAIKRSMQNRKISEVLYVNEYGDILHIQM